MSTDSEELIRPESQTSALFGARFLTSVATRISYPHCIQFGVFASLCQEKVGCGVSMPSGSSRALVRRWIGAAVMGAAKTKRAIASFSILIASSVLHMYISTVNKVCARKAMISLCGRDSECRRQQESEDVIAFATTNH